MMVRNLSPSTQQSYIYAVAKFSRHFDRSPDRLGLEDVRAYQLHLIAQKRSWSHVNQTIWGVSKHWGDRDGSDMTGRAVAGWGIVGELGFAVGRNGN
jgi:Phage integrase, N-terminal SAM-like domain